MRGERVVSLEEFLVGPKQNVLAEDELILGVTVDAGEKSRQTFMKVGPRNAMVIAVVSLAVRVEWERVTARSVRLRRACSGLVRAELGDADSFPQRVAEAASPIDDVRGTAAYRRHALRILTKRALDRCLV